MQASRREAYWPPLASAICLRWSPAKPPARSTQWIGIFRVLSLATSSTVPCGNSPSESKKHGIRLERKGLLYGRPRLGSAIGLDQAQPREQLALGLEVGRPAASARPASESTRCCRRSPRTSAAPCSAMTLLCSSIVARVRRSSSSMLPEQSTT